MKRSLGLSLLLTGAVAALGCTPPTSEDECVLESVTAWDGAKRDENAATSLALRGQLDALAVDAMRAAETGEGEAVLSELTALFEAGDPSLADITTDPWQQITADSLSEFVAVIAAGEQDLVDGNGDFAPGEAGGIYGSTFRGINTGGLEVRQLVDKGLFAGGSLYPYAIGLTEGEITPATVDELSALFGANADLDAAGELTDSANYAHRMGYHAPVAEALTRARAYAAEPTCAGERDQALVDFFRRWEEAMFARFAYYANAGVSGAALAVSADEYAAALHYIAEGIGLGLGFYGVEDPKSGPLAVGARLASDEQILDMMALLGVDVDDLGASTTGALVTDPAAFAAAVGDVESLMGEALGLDDAAVIAWRAPTEG